MKDEYVIINKTAIQKRIEELQKYVGSRRPSADEYAKMHIYREILSQSTPLLPELQKTWNAAYIDALSIDQETYKPLFFEDYIANLKLDI